MIKLGEKQWLTVAKTVEFGIYLTEKDGDEQKVLLPGKQVPEGIGLGDKIEVFVYKDSKDRIISTCDTPKITMEAPAVLKVISLQKIGAFLDWGLEKDLFLPYKEQLKKVSVDDEILVRLYIDKSQRLCGSMREIYGMLWTDSPYRTGDMVKGRIYEFSNNFGTFIAVDDKYSGRIPIFEDSSMLKIGDIVEARVTGVKQDGKLDLTLREKPGKQIGKDAEQILKIIEEFKGVLPFNDRASKEVIFRETKMSKNSFKRGVGKLYKERKIEITENSIRLL